MQYSSMACFVLIRWNWVVFRQAGGCHCCSKLLFGECQRKPFMDCETLEKHSWIDKCSCWIATFVGLQVCCYQVLLYEQIVTLFAGKNWLRVIERTSCRWSWTCGGSDPMTAAACLSTPDHILYVVSVFNETKLRCVVFFVFKHLITCFWKEVEERSWLFRLFFSFSGFLMAQFPCSNLLISQLLMILMWCGMLLLRWRINYFHLHLRFVFIMAIAFATWINEFVRG